MFSLHTRLFFHKLYLLLSHTHWHSLSLLYFILSFSQTVSISLPLTPIPSLFLSLSHPLNLYLSPINKYILLSLLFFLSISLSTHTNALCLYHYFFLLSLSLSLSLSSTLMLSFSTILSFPLLSHNQLTNANSIFYHSFLLLSVPQTPTYALYLSFSYFCLFLSLSLSLLHTNTFFL